MTQSPTKFRILLVEDDQPLAKIIAEFLMMHEFEVTIEHRGDAAPHRILQESPDAVVLDVNLPGQDGFAVCRSVREKYHGAIIILTARGGEFDEVQGLELGADDYLAKPVRPLALLARLRSHLRRNSFEESSSQPLVIGSLMVDASRRRVELSGREVELTSAEFDLLKLLADYAGKTLSRSEIHQSIHGIRYDGLDRSIDLRVSRLRKKLGDDPARPALIKSVRGTGYQLSIEQ